jgi:hypothetical protein
MSGTSDPTLLNLQDARIALGADVATSLYGVTGADIKIGIISDSYNNDGLAAQDVANGYLPDDVTVLGDLPGGGADEGRAMLELAYQIAPGAQLYFDTGITSLADNAAAVAALQAAGCQIIVDDLGFNTEESFFQIGTSLDQAIIGAVNAGVDYFSAAGNDGKSYYQGAFAPLPASIDGIGPVTATDFGGGNAAQSVTIQPGANVNLTLQWAQPFATIGTAGNSAQNSLAIYLLDAGGDVVAQATADQVGGNPVQELSYTNTSGSTAFSLMIVQNGGTVPAGEVFKYIVGNGSELTINDPNAGQGSGNIFGHELLTDQNSVGAVNFSQTPAFFVSPPQTESLSGVGPGELLFDAQGNRLAEPVDTAMPTFVAPDGSATSVPGFQSFVGTSAAAPNAAGVAALMLQADPDLSTTEVTAVLQQSAIPTTTQDGNDSGAGLIQARAAVEIAAAAAGVHWSDGAGGVWGQAANWSTGALPDSTQAVLIDDDLGAITTSYTVTLGGASDVAGSVALAAPGAQSVTLDVDGGGTLTVANTGTTDITGGELLVSNNATLALDGGILSAAGTLNVNNGIVDLLDGAASANGFAQNSGTTTLGGDAATLTLSGGFGQTGGTVTISALGTLDTTTANSSGGALDVAADGVLDASGTVAVYGSGSLSDSGVLSVLGGLILSDAPASVGVEGTVSAGGLDILSEERFAVAGGVTDTGVLTGDGTGTIDIATTGNLTVDEGAAGAAIAFSGDGGLLTLASSDPAVLQSDYTAPVFGLTLPGAGVDFTGIAYDATDTAMVTAGTLTLRDDEGLLATFQVDPSQSYDLVVNDLAGHPVVQSVACFLAGTRIRTPDGEVPVERLRAGGLVITADGACRPIVWIGHRRLDARLHPRPDRIQPIRIRKDAFADGVPCRDLLLSPDHAVLVDDVLIPVKLLENGGTVRRAAHRGVIDYFHIELDGHDVVVAEGLMVESYLDTGCRGMFDNGGGVVTLHPDLSRLARDALGCAPLVVAGPALAAARALLAQNALLITPPSTRSAAPVVAEARGLAR